MQKRDRSIFASAFLDGFSLAGLLTPLRRPGAPTQVFADAVIDQTPQGDSAMDARKIEEARRILTAAGFEVHPRKTSSVH